VTDGGLVFGYKWLTLSTAAADNFFFGGKGQRQQDGLP